LVLGVIGKRYGRFICIAVVLIEDVLDNCPSGTLIGVCFGWSTYIAMSLIEGACFLMPKGRSSWESMESLSSTTAGF